MVKTPLSALLDYAEEVRVEINTALSDYTEFGPGCPGRLQGAIRHSLLAPGKRLRPLLVLMAAEACGTDRQAAMPAACAVEMVHTFSLIHDDLPAMDDDDLRRGRPTCHAVFGEALAILAGDALLALSFEVLGSQIKPASVAARCCNTLGRAAGPTQLLGGQADDLQAEFSQQGVAELEAIHRRKTGALIRASLQIGGLVAPADQQRLLCLETYGDKLGLAFQIVDDLLDLDGQEADLGKRAKKDSRRGKLTFPRVLGADQSRKLADQLVQTACQALTPFGTQADRLQAMAQFVLDRNR